MIYLVSNNPELFSNELYSIISIEESLQKLNELQIVGLDTETEGLDPYLHKLLLLQLGCKDFQVVIDCRTVNPIYYKEYLESDRLFLGWNLKFDAKFLFKHKIYLQNVYDGFLAEKLLYLGYPNGFHSMSLKSAGETYLNIELDKSVRGKIIWSKVLTNDIIKYAADDVKYLEGIKVLQEKKLLEQGLQKAIQIENKFVLPLAYCEYCGIKLDVERWTEKMKQDNQREQEAKNLCNQWLINNYPECSYITTDLQGDLFTGFNTEPIVTINWNSSKQVIPIFQHFGVNTKVEDKENGGFKDSVEAKVLAPQADICSLIPLYLKYGEAAKVTSTYGQNFLDQINPVSGRIHTNYSQMGADTTRITSGGNDTVNLLNLPSDEITRSCFVAEKGNKFISIDYSGQETYLMASIANDTAIIKELTEGSGDIHSLTAYMSYKEIPRDTPIADIKKKFPHLRQEAKGIEFAINYGGSAKTISQNKGIPLSDAQIIYDGYMSGFKGLQQYQAFRRKDWWDKGYILLNPLTGHKAYIYDYDQLKKDWESFQEPGFWDYYREMKEEAPKCDTVQKVKHFFRRKSDSEKQSINYPIQATGSMCLRFSLIYFYNYLYKNNLFEKVKICVPPYDEINLEAPIEIADEIAQVIHKCMVKAGSVFCTRCRLDADISTLEDGSLPDYWIH